MKHLLYTLAFTIILTFFGCDSSEKVTIEGHISGAMGDTLTVSHLMNNAYVDLGSQVLKKNGKFSFDLAKQEFPAYYFIQVNNGKKLVVIRDSSDVIEVNASSGSFDDLNIVGSQVSVLINDMVKRVGVLRASYNNYLDNADRMTAEEKEVASEGFLVELKTEKDRIGKEIFTNPSSYYSYYALFQRLSAESLLFSPYNEEDYTYFAAVATSYDLFHSGDPRTISLYKMVESVLAQKRKVKLQQMIDQAPSGLPDIIMDDLKGKERKLSDLKGKVVVLNFWASKSQEARMLNRNLKEIYSKYKSKGLSVFQVSADKSKLLWEDAILADKLPWVNVCDFKEGASKPFTSYNVRQVPTTFLINKKGEMIGRYDNPQELEKAIKQAL